MHNSTGSVSSATPLFVILTRSLLYITTSVASHRIIPHRSQPNCEWCVAQHHIQINHGHVLSFSALPPPQKTFTGEHANINVQQCKPINLPRLNKVHRLDSSTFDSSEISTHIQATTQQNTTHTDHNTYHPGGDYTVEYTRDTSNIHHLVEIYPIHRPHLRSSVTHSYFILAPQLK